jgi:hypothetical protein
MLEFAEKFYDSIFNLSGKEAAKKDLPENLKIYGLPLSYSNLADPGGRVFRKTILRRIPIVSIQPGMAKSTIGDLPKEAQDSLKQRLEDVEKWTKSGGSLEDKEAKEALDDAYFEMASNSESFPYLLFKSASKEFQDAYTTLATRVFSRLDIMNNKSMEYSDSSVVKELWASLAEDLSTQWVSNGWINFYMDRGSSITESGGNTYNDSTFSQMAKKLTSISTEISLLLGEGQAETNTSTGSSGTGILSKISDAMKGHQVVFPKVWQDSTFSRSYNLRFKFESPYGDPMSIWRHVYAPFLIMLTLAMPRQTGVSSYNSPFLVRVDCPGLTY